MRQLPRTRRLLAVALLTTLACCASARAAFTPFALVSADPAGGLEADYAYDPAISGGGRYVAFTGSVTSQPGVYRKDLVTGALAPVALGTHAGAPSVSEDGRYVSFTTDENPATGAASGGPGVCSSVYVRDMQQPLGQPGAFTLVSARDGSVEGLAYSPPAGARTCGSAAAARVALSADGSTVAFTVLSPSDLTGACEMQEETLKCPTPEDQVAVRDWKAQRTTLVSATRASLGGTPAPIPRGAALAGPTSSGQISLPNGGSTELAVGASTAAISADGSTVAWMGIDVAEQAPVAQPPTLVLNYPDSYAEPLWRRIADGSGALTRRMLAGDDPSAPQCPPACPGGLDLEWDTQGISGSEYTGTAPQYGSYTSQAGQSNGFGAGAGLGDPLAAVTPQLSADGMTVALLSTQPDYGADPNFGLFNATVPPPANAFVVHMAPGLTRAQAIRRLTDWASLDFGNAELDSPIKNIALSPDGTRVAFTTERIAFPLAPPALITPTVSQAGVTQLYEANLPGGTLAMVSFGYDGQPANDGVIATAFSADGKTLALSSAATNLVYGVVNEGSDVYVTEEIHSPPAPGQQSVGPLPPDPVAEIPWNISATASPSPDGSLDLYVSVPGAGRLSASAVSAISRLAAAGHRPHRTTKRGHARPARAAQRRGSHTPRRSTAPARRGHRPTAPRGTTIARAAANAAGPDVIELHLVPAARYDALLQSSSFGLYTTIAIVFTAPGHPPVRITLRASFPHRPAIYEVPKSGYPLPHYRLPRHAAPKHKPRHGKRRQTRRGGHR
ncbi:MAG TPA: hypothetical protein VID29_08220 [Solirubrobacteraceae bacterium]